ncbi:taurine dioxygenase [Pigmentiphaga sp. NML080357]|uniref:TauD/TfdA dioxygenase family protein n=1 Tax=Pigmentiphaga sp. NML080357 TaxID=2008675 RepID=UPI000B41D142|nr:TauD/TfdA family dioxygenase [Pigmentiphaga sp. NML080357]OVZ58870.1 taurine dioxygenase [Pigmentiphaga sp. NML080357]
MSAVLAAPPSTIDVLPQSAHIGAEIRGVDLSRPLDPAQVADIRNALLRWKVLFFRDQPLTHAQHVSLARQFGEPTIGHPVFGFDPDYPEIYSVARDRKKARYQGAETVRPWTGWHTDVTAAINPPYASILRGVVIPPYSGDTQWTNLAAAYQALSEPLRNFVDGLRGLHRYVAPQGSTATADFLDKVQRRPLLTEHPLVRVHPETGEKSLMISPTFLQSIVGLAPRESQQILELLFEHAIRPEFTVRFKWETGSIAFWDNRSTAHLAPQDVFATEFDRQLYRITLGGEVPVGPDGRPSVALEGDPITAARALQE